MRMTVAAEKTFQPQHVAIVGAADDDRAAGAGFEQADAAQDQRAHDPFAELGFRNQQRAEPVRRNDQACTGSRAMASTSAGRPASCASSPMNWPGPSRDDQRSRSPDESRWIMSTWPARTTTRP